MSNNSAGWSSKRSRTLSARLLDLYVETGQTRLLDMARKAQSQQLGKAQVAKAWELVKGQEHNKRRQPHPSERRAAEQRAIAAEKRAKAAEERIAKLEAKLTNAPPEDKALAQVTDTDMAAAPAAERRPAPEVAAAEAEAHAIALEESAARLHAAGLVKESEELVKKASLHRKKLHALPSLAKQVDLKKAFVKRAEGRLEKGHAKVQSAKADLKKAEDELEELKAELGTARAQLAKLRTELASEDASEDVVIEENAESTQLAQDNLVQLRTQLAAAQAEVASFAQAAKVSHVAAAAERQAVTALASLGVPELQGRVEKCFAEHTKAMTTLRWDAANSLAETMRRLTSALEQAHAAAAQEPSAFNPAS